jgi:hypothetical protein
MSLHLLERLADRDLALEPPARWSLTGAPRDRLRGMKDPLKEKCRRRAW